MNVHPLAGKPAPTELLIDVSKLERDYYENKPEISDPHQLVSFGTSGHRGTSASGNFNEAHSGHYRSHCDYASAMVSMDAVHGQGTDAFSAPAQAHGH